MYLIHLISLRFNPSTNVLPFDSLFFPIKTIGVFAHSLQLFYIFFLPEVRVFEEGHSECISLALSPE